jgi:carbamoyltransferase
MRVLGISPLDKDSTVSFLEDGRCVFACAEERLSRVKLQDGFPARALRLGLEATGWGPDSIDAVAYAFFDGATEGRLISEGYQREGRDAPVSGTAASLRRLAGIRGYRVDRSLPIPGFTDEAAEFLPPKSWTKRLAYRSIARWAPLDWATHRAFYRRWVRSATADHHLRTEQLHQGLAEFGLLEKLRRFNHHDTHAANSFYASGFDRALVVTLDGYGSGNCGGIYTAGPEGIAALHKFAFPHSLGQFYEHVTSGLGFKAGRHEGKIVGLAAYGDPRILGPAIRDRFVLRDGDIQIRGSMNYLFTRYLAGGFAKRDVAAAYQRVLEEIVQVTLRYWLDRTGLTKVVVSGGVHANVKLNQRMREVEGVEAIFVYPNMGDGGCATGAAMLVAGHAACSGRGLDHAYLGPDYSESQIEAALRREGLAFEFHGEIEERVGELLAEDAIVGRFTGRMEYGPRALGNRSVLYPAQDPAVNQWLNHQLGRTEFMPFAPAALADASSSLFLNVAGCEKTAEYMTITFDCTTEMQRMCPAAVHVDGTARPQLVSERTNPSFAKILRAYHRRTGIPAVINTSFNMHEEPIVCSPADAIRAFLLGNLDYLAIGPFLAPHPRVHEGRHGRRREQEAAVTA